MSARQVLILRVLRLEGRAAPTECYGLTTGRLSQRLQSSVPFCVGSACPLMSRLETVERYAQPVQRTEWAAGLHNFRRVATVLARVRRCVEMFPGLPLRASAPESAGGVIIPLCPPPRHPVRQLSEEQQHTKRYKISVRKNRNCPAARRTLSLSLSKAPTKSLTGLSSHAEKLRFPSTTENAFGSCFL